LDPYVVQSDT